MMDGPHRSYREQSASSMRCYTPVVCASSDRCVVAADRQPGRLSTGAAS